MDKRNAIKIIMESNSKEFCLEVWGDMACFTRPELKVERVSYDVITPSAARAVYEAIFWKPAIRWQVTKIEVMNPIKWLSIRRNEVGKVSNRSVFIEDERQQRNALLLRDVRYRLWAELVYIPVGRRKGENKTDGDHTDESPAKYQAIFERRASRGQCFTQPYLGTREFSAYFRLTDADSQTDAPIAESRDLGIMLYDMDFEDNPDKPGAMFFRAKMENGVIIVPPIDSKEVLR